MRLICYILRCLYKMHLFVTFCSILPRRVNQVDLSSSFFPLPIQFTTSSRGTNSLLLFDWETLGRVWWTSTCDVDRQRLLVWPRASFYLCAGPPVILTRPILTEFWAVPRGAGAQGRPFPFPLPPSSFHLGVTSFTHGCDLPRRHPTPACLTALLICNNDIYCWPEREFSCRRWVGTLMWVNKRQSCLLFALR